LSLDRLHASIIVALGVRMLTAVELNNQTPFETRKIGNERADSDLAAKFGIAKLPVAERAPQNSLYVGLVAAEIAGAD